MRPQRELSFNKDVRSSFYIAEKMFGDSWEVCSIWNTKLSTGS